MKVFPEFVEAFVEYDDTQLYGISLRPFTGGVSEFISFIFFLKLREDFDAAFVSAIVGSDFENQEILSRGLPQNASIWAREGLRQPLEGVEPMALTWISFSELRQGMELRKLKSEDLNLATRVLWDVLLFLARSLGDERVRLILRLSRKRSAL